jgi:hypothetical protein
VTLSVALTPASPAAPAPSGTVALYETQVATVTASQSNYTGTFTASLGSGCGSAATLTSASPKFTVTAVSHVTGCTLTVTGGTGGAPGSSTASQSFSVLQPGGVQLNWVSNAAYATQAAPITPVPGPINLIGVTSTFGAVLVVSETNWIAALGAPTESGACGANLSAPSSATQGNIAGPITGQAQAFYSISAPAAAVAFPTSAGCSVSVPELAPDPLATPVPPYTTPTIGVELTTTGGGIQ